MNQYLITKTADHQWMVERIVDTFKDGSISTAYCDTYRTRKAAAAYVAQQAGIASLKEHA